MTNPIEKHIADSLKEYEKSDLAKRIWEVETIAQAHGYPAFKSKETIPQLTERLLTKQLSIARGEVEKKKNTAILGTEESSQAYKHKTDGYHRAIQDVLDTLTITNLTKE